MHKTSAWPLAQVYLGLIVYASLYPFVQWRDQGISPWYFVMAPWPKYWTGFDVVANVLGYMPLGFLLVLAALRSGHRRFAFRLVLLVGGCLSFTMESLQAYLPTRVPSNLDLALNIAGTFAGAGSAWGLEKFGLLQRWSRFRSSWFAEEARGALVLLALWPLALLFPTMVPLGLGQVMERLEGSLTDVLTGTPFLQWLPVRDVELQPLLPVAEWLCVMLGLLIPGLLGYCIIRQYSKRLWFLVWLTVFGVGATALSGALSFGPEHAWVWFDAPVRGALVVALVLLVAIVAVSLRASAALAVLALGIYLSLINQTTVGPYFDQTIFLWEQGKFIRFHGLAQWLGWLWPFAALAYVLSRVWSHEPQT
jgi:VanZ family protein